MKYTNTQFIIVPNELLLDKRVKNHHKYIYLCIRSFINEYDISYPTKERIASMAKCSISTVNMAIKILAELEYIEVYLDKEHKKIIYIFPDKNEDFSMISYDLIYTKNLDISEKKYLLALYPHLTIQEDIGYIIGTKQYISKLVNINRQTFKLLNKSLVEKGILEINDNTGNNVVRDYMFNLSYIQSPYNNKQSEDEYTLDKAIEVLKEMKSELAELMEENRKLRKSINR